MVEASDVDEVEVSVPTVSLVETVPPLKVSCVEVALLGKRYAKVDAR